jgi:MFS family permease
MSSGDSAPRRRVRPEVFLLAGAAFLNDVSSEMIYPLLPLFLATSIGATPFIIGMIEGTAEALSSILKLVAGWWSDRAARRKPFIVAGYGLAALARAIIPAATHWSAIFGARLLDRTGKGIRSAPRDAMICDVTPESDRGRAFGVHRAFDHAGAVVGPLLAALLLGFAAMEMRTLFVVALIPSAAGVLILLLMLREPPRAAPMTGEGATRVASALAPGALPRRFTPAIVSVGLFAFANSSDVFLILRAHESGVRTAWIPILWGVHHLIRSSFTFQAGALSDRVDRRYLLIAGWLAYAVIYTLFPFADSLPLFLLLFVAYALPFTLAEPAERAWIADGVAGGSRGKAFGIFYLVSGFASLAGTALFGLLYQELGARTAFFTGAAISTTAALSVAVQKGSRMAGE